MRNLSLFMLTALFFSFTGVGSVVAGDHHSSPYTGSAEFQRMKQLVGVWEGTSDMGKPGEKVRVEYRLTAGGSALIETLFPGNPEEMVSVYHDQNGKLAMTHYCMLHNQPHMTLARSDDRTIDLVFAGSGNDIDPAKEKHMHGVAFTFPDKDHMVQKWTMFDKGTEAGGVTLRLERVH